MCKRRGPAGSDGVRAAWRKPRAPSSPALGRHACPHESWYLLTVYVHRVEVGVPELRNSFEKPLEAWGQGQNLEAAVPVGVSGAQALLLALEDLLTALSGMTEVETLMITYAVIDMAPYSFLFDDEILPLLIFFSLCFLGSSFIFWGGGGVGNVTPFSSEFKLSFLITWASFCPLASFRAFRSTSFSVS